MTIKINNVVVNSEVLPINKPSLDETLETFSFALKSTTESLPYAPMQKVEITTDGNEVINLLIVSDTVEIFSLNPTTYKHNITCIENTRELSKHIVRNSIFSQPATLTKESFNAICVGAGFSTIGEQEDVAPFSRINERGNGSNNPASISIPLDSKEKIKKAYIRIDLQIADGVVGTSSADIHTDKATWKNDFHSFSELQNYYANTNTLTLNNLTLSYVMNGQTLTESVDISNIPFNTNFEYPRIAELSQQGASDFELLFSNRLLIDGTLEYQSNEHYFKYYQAQVKIVAETYYYNAYELLDLILKRQRQQYSTTNRTYQKEDLFKLPLSGDLYTLLNNTIVPNFTFTQLTLYECVAEVFRLFDAIFTMDSDGTLGITYFNQANNTTKTFDFSGMDISISEDKYTNALQSYYQEAKQKIDFPNNNNFIPVRSNELGIPEEQDHYVITPHEIHSVEKLYLALEKVSVVLNLYYLGQNAIEITGVYPLDLSYYVVDSSVWSVLPVGTNLPINPNTLYQNNTIQYERFSNKINIAFTYKTSWSLTDHAFSNALDKALARNNGFITSSSNISMITPTRFADWSNYKFKVSYIASLDGTTKTHALINKTDGETLIDQNNGAVDLKKLGLNMLGTVLKLGEPSLNATQKITTWENRVKIGDVITYQGERWIANVVAYNLLGNGYIQTKINFVKNFNALALYTKINRVRRMTNISNELTQKSEDIITNFIYFAGEESNDIPSNFQGIRQEIPFVESYLAKCLYLSFTNDESLNLSIDFFVCRSHSDRIRQVYISNVIYGAGNTINFEMSFNNSISAGYQTTYGEESTWYGADKYFTQSVNYTDDYGFMDYCDIRLFGNSNIVFSQYFPDITDDIAHASPTPASLIVIDSYYVYKQPNEIFSLNYQLAFLGLDHTKDFVGGAFINDNFFIDGFQKSRKLKLYYTTNRNIKYNVLDTKAKGVLNQEIVNVDYEIFEDLVVPGQNYIKITFETENAYNPTIHAYAICDENNNILFAFNRTTSLSDKKVSIYFIARHNRK